MSDKEYGNVTIPSGTRVFVCADCGALALSPSNICRVQGMVTKADFCGTESMEMARGCRNNRHNLRFKCRRCHRVAVNPEILCDPEKISPS